MDFRPGTQRLNGLLSRNPEARWTFVQEPGGWMDFHLGTRRLDGLSFWNPEAGWTIVLEPGGWLDYRPGTRRLDGLSSWNPEAGTVLRLPRQDYYRYLFGFRILPLGSWPLSSSYAVFYFCRKSLTGLEGDGVGVMTQVPGFAAFHVWRSRVLIAPCISQNWHVSYDAPCVRVSVQYFALYGLCSLPESKRVSSSGSTLHYMEYALCLRASSGQDTALVILLSQVLLRSGPCSNLGENKYPGDRPGSCRRFQFSLLGTRPDRETFDASVGINISLPGTSLNLEESRFPRDRHESNGYSQACALFRSIDLGRFRILALHVDGWQDPLEQEFLIPYLHCSDKRDLSSKRRTSPENDLLNNIHPDSRMEKFCSRNRRFILGNLGRGGGGARVSIDFIQHRTQSSKDGPFSMSIGRGPMSRLCWLPFADPFRMSSGPYRAASLFQNCCGTRGPEDYGDITLKPRGLTRPFMARVEIDPEAGMDQFWSRTRCLDKRCRVVTRSSCPLPPLGSFAHAFLVVVSSSEVYQSILPGKAVLRWSEAGIGNLEAGIRNLISIFPGSFAGGRAAVFPALGQGSFRGTTPMEFDEYSKAFYPLS
ncbi:hypothetical protein YC2023_117609 [Brassica napus]